MSETTTNIAEFTVMNNDSKQAIFMTQMRDLSERMAEVAESHGGWMADMHEERYCHQACSEAHAPGSITL